jgi:hypothetical protein
MGATQVGANCRASISLRLRQPSWRRSFFGDAILATVFATLQRTRTTRLPRPDSFAGMAAELITRLASLCRHRAAHRQQSGSPFLKQRFVAWRLCFSSCHISIDGIRVLRPGRPRRGRRTVASDVTVLSPTESESLRASRPGRARYLYMYSNPAHAPVADTDTSECECLLVDHFWSRTSFDHLV